MSNVIQTPVSSVTWSATGLPDGCTLGEHTGIITGTPTTTGDYTVNLTAESNWGTATGSITIYVKDGPTRYAVRRDGNELTRISMADLKQKIADRTLEETFQVGDQLILPWTDPYNGTEYECPMNFGTIKNFTLEDDSPAYGLGLQAEYALPVCGYIQFDSKEPSNPDSGPRSYGYSRWSVSNIRQWMNARGKPWYSAQHEADAEPTYAVYKSISGLLDSFPVDLLDVLTPVKNVTRAPSGGLDVTLDTLFLLSTHELFANPSSDALDDDTEGAYWRIWKLRTGLEDFQTTKSNDSTQEAYRRYKIENHSNSTSVYLRNCYGNLPWKVWCMDGSGCFSSDYPSLERRLTPACAIC